MVYWHEWWLITIINNAHEHGHQINVDDEGQLLLLQPDGTRGAPLRLRGDVSAVIFNADGGSNAQLAAALAAVAAEGVAKSAAAIAGGFNAFKERFPFLCVVRLQLR